MRIIEVYLDNENIETVFWYGKRDELIDIKQSLVKHDGYDANIELREVIEEEV